MIVNLGIRVFWEGVGDLVIRALGYPGGNYTRELKKDWEDFFNFN